MKVNLWGEKTENLNINPEIFKKYDIRGRFPEELDEKVFYLIGQSFCEVLRAKNIVVGSDNRVSSPRLKKALISGLISRGAKVSDIGFCTTPVLYWSVNYLKVEAGLMITASHLEKDFNGLKMVLKGEHLREEELLRLKEFVLSRKSKLSLSSRGTVFEKDISKGYVRQIRERIVLPWPRLKIVMDSGNGPAGLYLKDIFRKSDIKVIPLFWDLDARFPNRGLDQRKKANREKLAQRIMKEKADLGFIWDGDADRFYVLDGGGMTVDPSFVAAILARYLVGKSENKKVVTEVRTSRVVKDEIEKMGGDVFITKAWHTEIKKVLRDNPEIIFGSETSGHYVFKDFYCLDDGILAAVYFLNALSAQGKEIKAIIREFSNRYFIIEEKNFPLSAKERERVLKGLEVFYRQRGGDIIWIDGLSCDFLEWRFNLRPSLTEPVLRLNLEADSKELMTKKGKEVSELVRRYSQPA